MSSEDGERAPREVKDHVLFEIATEVAHRGTYDRLGVSIRIQHVSNPTCSRRHLLGHQVQSASDNGRIWRAVHPYRASEPPIGQSFLRR